LRHDVHPFFVKRWGVNNSLSCELFIGVIIVNFNVK
jgi:hypothetical protein